MTDYLKSFLQLFDHYSLIARLQPALIALLPGVCGVLAWTGLGNKGIAALWTLFATVGGTVLLATIVRNRGNSLQQDLWKSWGGAPTTQLLRHSNLGNPILRSRWHEHLSKLIGKPFPSIQNEQADPIAADYLYEASIKLLIQQRRDKKSHPLIYKENVNYGFCRNLYGLRPIGIVVSLSSLVASVASGVVHRHSANPDLLPWIYALLSFCMLLVWVFLIKSDWVKVPAFGYAERLLESIDTVKVRGTGTTARAAKTEK